jgi:hypothetical protein
MDSFLEKNPWLCTCTLEVYRSNFMTACQSIFYWLTMHNDDDYDDDDKGDRNVIKKPRMKKQM